MNKAGKIHIGTSGWYYKHWIDNFYPQKIAPNELLNYYTIHFNTVELNNTFYRLPPKETFENWFNAVPDQFQFSIKASRLITHNKKLIDGEQSVEILLDRAQILGNKLGPILFQLPPTLKINIERLRNFMKYLPAEFRYVFEFRNNTWFTSEVYDLLSQYNMAFCIYEIEHHLSPINRTADFIYIRLHGPGQKYRGSYSDKILYE